GDRFVIERAEGSGGFARVGLVHDSHRHVDSGLSAGVTYRYRVRSRTLAGESDPSAASAATTLPAANALSSVRVWLRADSGMRLLQGGRVAEWSDQSGHGNHARQRESANQPLWSSAGA